jgi:AcrR family transcriptional regulator
VVQVSTRQIELNHRHMGITEPPAEPRRRGRPPSVDRPAALAATRRVIARRGLDRARYSDIAEESGVAVSTLQHAFGRLDEILELALDQARELDAAFLDTLPSADDASAWERVEAFIAGALGSPIDPASNDPASSFDGWLIWVELWRSAARDGAGSARTIAAYERWWSSAEEIIAAGQRDGSFTSAAPARELAVALNALIDGIAVSLLFRHDRGDVESARGIATRTARLALRPEPAGIGASPDPA